MKISAKGMFKRLGYEISDANQTMFGEAIITYEHKKESYEIVFFLKDHVWLVRDALFGGTIPSEPLMAQAIIKQCEELGWL